MGRSVCIIGTGASGLSSIKHAIEFDMKVTAFERSDKIGGTWVYEEAVGKDKHGLDRHTSMYKNLITNLPIEVMCYPDEKFPENENSFVSSEVVLRYYEQYADKYNLRDHIKFEHNVERVNPLFDDSWEVLVRNLPAGTYETYNFDSILICNGHFNIPFIPQYEGRNEFKGKQIHSHDYRYPEPFKDEAVLVIGGNYSAVDIAQQTAEYAKSVAWSHHLVHAPDLKQLGENVIEKPDVKKLSEDSVEFIDGTVSQFSTIFYCTGYGYKFPFLSVDCGISTCESYVKPLFKHCLNINRPTMGFIGLPNLICPNQMFSLQARFCLKFMSGQKKLPSKEEMMKDYEVDMEQRWKKGLPKKKGHVMGPDIQDRYYEDLAATAEIEPIKPVMPRMRSGSVLGP